MKNAKSKNHKDNPKYIFSKGKYKLEEFEEKFFKIKNIQKKDRELKVCYSFENPKYKNVDFMIEPDLNDELFVFILF